MKWSTRASSSMVAWATCGNPRSSGRRVMHACWQSVVAQRKSCWKKWPNVLHRTDTGIAMTQDTLQTELTAGVATIRMNRPEVHNAFDDILIAALTAELR